MPGLLHGWLGPIYFVFFAGPGLLLAWSGSRLDGSDLLLLLGPVYLLHGLVNFWLGPIHFSAGPGLLLAWSGPLLAGSGLLLFGPVYFLA